MDIFKTVREAVTAREAAEMYGVEVKNSKARCIWHDDRNPSLSFKDNRCHCFTCGNGGSAVDVTMKLHGLTAKAAAEKLGVDFGLDLGTGGKRHEIQPREPTDRDAVDIWYKKRWDENCAMVHKMQAILDTFTDLRAAFNNPYFTSSLRARSKAYNILYKLTFMSEREKTLLYRKEVLKHED